MTKSQASVGPAVCHIWPAQDARAISTMARQPQLRVGRTTPPPPASLPAPRSSSQEAPSVLGHAAASKTHSISSTAAAEFMAQDPQASARFELAEAVRKQHTESICRALALAVRSRVPADELEAALRALSSLVRRSYLKEAAADSFGERCIEEIKASAFKLDSVATDLVAIKAHLGVTSSAAPSNVVHYPGSYEADAGSGGSGWKHTDAIRVREDVKSMTPRELQEAIVTEQALADAAMARLRLLQDEALRRVCSATTATFSEKRIAE